MEGWNLNPGRGSCMHAYAPLRPRTVSLVERTQVVVKSARSGFSSQLGPLFAMQAFFFIHKWRILTVATSQSCSKDERKEPDRWEERPPHTMQALSVVAAATVTTSHHPGPFHTHKLFTSATASGRDRRTFWRSSCLTLWYFLRINSDSGSCARQTSWR